MHDRAQLAALMTIPPMSEAEKLRQEVFAVVEKMKDAAQMRHNLGQYGVAEHLLTWARKVESTAKKKL